MRKIADVLKKLLVFSLVLTVLMGGMFSSVVIAGEIDTPAKAVKLGEVTYELNYENSEAVVCRCTASGDVKIRSCININGKKFRVVHIADRAFYNNKKVKSVVIPSSITDIGKRAFYGCSRLDNIIIRSKRITDVGKYAFKNIGTDCMIRVPTSKKKIYEKLIGKGRVC